MVAAALLFGSALAAEPAVQRSYDPQKKQTRVYVSFDFLPKGKARDRLGLTAQGIVEDPSQIELQFRVESGTAKVTKCKSATLTADDKKVPLGPFASSGGDRMQPRGITYYTTTTTKISPKVLAQLGGASRINGKFCGSKLSLKAEQVAALRALAVELGAIPK